MKKKCCSGVDDDDDGDGLERLRGSSRAAMDCVSRVWRSRLMVVPDVVVEKEVEGELGCPSYILVHVTVELNEAAQSLIDAVVPNTQKESALGGLDKFWK